MKRKTNVQIVRSIMERSRFGALSQAFVIDALTKHADACAAMEPKDFGERSWVNPDAWIGVAKEIQGILDAHYKGDKP